MARTYWDRWQWELQKRRKEIHKQFTGCSSSSFTSSPLAKIHEIEPTYLCNPKVDGKVVEVYIGRGSFSVVRLQYYRGFKVAVKEFLPHTLNPFTGAGDFFQHGVVELFKNS